MQADTLNRLWNHPATFWLLLAIPSFGLLASALSGNDLEPLLHPTGEFSARMMIVAMLLTPLRMLFPKARWIRWLMRRRRYLGVAAFGYALLHTLYYLIDIGSLSVVAAEFTRLGIWTGWLAFVVFVPLALTSNDASVRRLGQRWKSLQRFVYLAAIATCAHWLFVSQGVGPALVHFVPLGGLELWRYWQVNRVAGNRVAGSNAPDIDPTTKTARPR